MSDCDPAAFGLGWDIAKSFLGSAFGAAFAILTAFYIDNRTRTKRGKRQRYIIVAALKKLKNDVQESKIMDTNYLLTGVVSAGYWYTGEFIGLIQRIQFFISDTRSAVEPQDFVDVHALWLASDACTTALSNLDLQDKGLDSPNILDNDEYWTIFKDTMGYVRTALVLEFDEAIALLTK